MKLQASRWSAETLGVAASMPTVMKPFWSSPSAPMTALLLAHELPQQLGVRQVDAAAAAVGKGVDAAAAAVHRVPLHRVPVHDDDW
jgi:hypothetical protein